MTFEEAKRLWETACCEDCKEEFTAFGSNLWTRGIPTAIYSYTGDGAVQGRNKLAEFLREMADTIEEGPEPLKVKSEQT